MQSLSNEQSIISHIFSDENEVQLSLSQISHELRNPITLINTYLHLFASKHPEAVDCEYWHHIMSNMEFLKTLLNELSDFNHSYTLHTKMIHMTDFLKDVFQELAPLFETSNISIDYSLEPSVQMLKIDPTKLKQVLFNIIRNSMEAIQTHGHISIRSSCREHHFVLEIADNGPGIPKDYINNIFEPFVTYKTEGTGLGLSIAKNIIHAHNGTIHVQSKEGCGTTFVIKLPL